MLCEKQIVDFMKLPVIVKFLDNYDDRNYKKWEAEVRARIENYLNKRESVCLADQITWKPHP